MDRRKHHSVRYGSGIVAHFILPSTIAAGLPIHSCILSSGRNILLDKITMTYDVFEVIEREEAEEGQRAGRIKATPGIISDSERCYEVSESL